MFYNHTNIRNLAGNSKGTICLTVIANNLLTRIFVILEMKDSIKNNGYLFIYLCLSIEFSQ